MTDLVNRRPPAVKRMAMPTPTTTTRCHVGSFGDHLNHGCRELMLFDKPATVPKSTATTAKVRLVAFIP